MRYLLIVGAFFCLPSMLFGCNQLPKAATASSKAVKGMRQGITLEMNARCKEAAATCPKKTVDAKLSDCEKYVQCRDLRRSLYKGTNGYQIACHTVMGLYQVGKKEEAAKLWLGLGSKLLELKNLLQKHKIVPKGALP